MCYPSSVVCLSVCHLSHSCTLFKPFDRFSCHLADTLAWSIDTLCQMGFLTPRGREDLGYNSHWKHAILVIHQGVAPISDFACTELLWPLVIVHLLHDLVCSHQSPLVVVHVVVLSGSSEFLILWFKVLPKFYFTLCVSRLCSSCQSSARTAQLSAIRSDSISRNIALM